MTYYPRVRLSERNGRIQDGVPASGVVAGLLSQNDQSGMWRKLEEGDMRLKAGLSLIENVADRQHLMLHRNRVNIFSRSSQGTSELRGNVTLAGPRVVSQLWQRLDRRRLASSILGTLERHTAWALAQTRDDQLWQALTHQVSLFLTGLFEHGALAGHRSGQVFPVRTGPALRRDDTELVLRVGFALEKTGEFQVYDIVHSSDGSSSRSAPPLEAVQLA